MPYLRLKSVVLSDFVRFVGLGSSTRSLRHNFGLGDDGIFFSRCFGNFKRVRSDFDLKDVTRYLQFCELPFGKFMMNLLFFFVVDII